MLTHVDRLQMAVSDRRAVAGYWQAALDAEHEADDAITCLGARRTTLRLGRGRVELLEPDGSGLVQEAIAARGNHLNQHLRSRGSAPSTETGQVFLHANDPAGLGINVVISREEALPPTGLLDRFYETSPLVNDSPARVRRCAELFDLDPDNFVPISSDNYGYEGTLTLFRAGHLDRFEIITPNDASTTMGRFFDKTGECYYMAFAESEHMTTIAERVREHSLGHTRVPPDRPESRPADTIFLHPPALGGMMLGISRPTMAWQWSGQPDKVEPLA